MKIPIGARVRIKGSKIEGVAAAEDVLDGARRLRVDAKTDAGDGEYWTKETDLEVVAESSDLKAPTSMAKDQA